MANTTPTTYGNYIVTLNPHLFINQGASESGGSTTCNSTVTIGSGADSKRGVNDPALTQTIRRAPVFLCNKDVIKQRLIQDFKITEEHFVDHVVNYSAHVIEKEECVLKGQSASQHIIDVRFMWGYGFYHFITEVLPAVLEINKPDCPILLNYCPFAERVFRWFGVKNQLIYKMPAAVNVIYRMPVIECGLPSPRKLELIRSVIEKKISSPSKEIGVAIFREEHLRRILNFDEVVATLRAAFPDVEWHIYNKQPIEEAAELFSRAKYVFAPHGAGLSNIIFCSKGTIVIELIDLYKPNLCYWHLSELLGHAHYMIPLFAENHQFQVDCWHLKVFIGILKKRRQLEQHP